GGMRSTKKRWSTCGAWSKSARSPYTACPHSTSTASRRRPGGESCPALLTVIPAQPRSPHDLQLYPDQPVSVLSAPLQASLPRWLERERHPCGDAVRPDIRTSRGRLLPAAGRCRGALPGVVHSPGK